MHEYIKFVSDKDIISINILERSILHILAWVVNLLLQKRWNIKSINCVEFLDELQVPVRSQDRNFRAIINDIYKVSKASLVASIKIEGGFIENGEKVYVMPNADPVIIKGIVIVHFLI